MSKLNIVFCLLVFSLACYGQTDCDMAFAKDTLFIPKEQKVLNGEYVETTLKNQSVVRFFKTDNNKFYLRLIITEDFYFDKVGTLEIKSGGKSYWEKDARQCKINKTRGFYVLEITRNYIASLREYGITSIVFSKAETDFTRQDANQIKKIAACFYETAFVKK